jgi:hypothetical protein
VTLDEYGGITQLPSPNGASGFFRLEIMNNHWTFIDPLGNAFFLLGVDGLGSLYYNNFEGISYTATVTTKYGDSNITWGPAQVQRLKSWGFNTVSTYNSPYVLPTTNAGNSWPGDHYNPQKMPFVNYTLKISYYGMLNLSNFVSEPIKNFQFAINTQYDTNYIPPAGEADYEDPKLLQYLDGMLANDSSMTALNNVSNPYRQWLIGMTTDEADQTYSFNTGTDFPTTPTGHGHAHGGYRVAICSPIQTANSSKSAIYSDTTVHNKMAWATYLQGLSKYQTNGLPDIGKLNAAWGSNYTTWNSSGRPITGASLGTGDGSNTTFPANLSQKPISEYSVQILVAGSPVGGDQGNGTIWGPNLSGTINYTTGALTITFAAGYAPANGAAVTTNYVAGGWGVGTGLLDEDGRNTSWMGTDSVNLTGSNANFVTDINGFLYKLAYDYFSGTRTHTLSHFNSVQSGWQPLFFGPNSVMYWDSPPRAPVLQAASTTLDALLIVGNPATQEELDFIYTNAGNKPLIEELFSEANPDSALFAVPPDYSQTWLEYTTQQSRAAGYASLMLAAKTASPPGIMAATYTGNGVSPYVGMTWWQYVDQVPTDNFGLVTPSDNAYDGNEAVTAAVPCSAPLAAYTCGGEQNNYGNLLTGAGGVASTNTSALQMFMMLLMN